MCTNFRYGKGMVVYYNNSNLNGSDFDWLNNRPLVVVSEPIQIFDYVTVVPMTTQNRPGIRVSMFDSITNTYRESVIEPWTVFTIPCDGIRKTNGILDNRTMKAVSSAVAFHLGLIDEIPPYLKSMKELLFSPKYVEATSDNIQKISLERIAGVTLPNLRLGERPSENRYLYSSNTESAVEIAYNNAIVEAAANNIDTNSEVEEVNEDITPLKESESDNSAKVDYSQYYTTTEYDNNKYRGAGRGLYTTLEITKEFNLSSNDIYMILRRDYTIKDLSKITHISTHYVKVIRDEFIGSSSKMMKDINKKMKNQAINFIKLTEKEKIAICCNYINWKEIKVIDVSNFIDRINSYRRLHNINLTDAKKWKNVGLIENRLTQYIEL